MTWSIPIAPFIEHAQAITPEKPAWRVWVSCASSICLRLSGVTGCLSCICHVNWDMDSCTRKHHWSANQVTWIGDEIYQDHITWQRAYLWTPLDHARCHLVSDTCKVGQFLHYSGRGPEWSKTACAPWPVWFPLLQIKLRDQSILSIRWTIPYNPCGVEHSIEPCAQQRSRVICDDSKWADLEPTPSWSQEPEEISMLPWWQNDFK